MKRGSLFKKMLENFYVIDSQSTIHNKTPACVFSISRGVFRVGQPCTCPKRLLEGTPHGHTRGKRNQYAEEGQAMSWPCRQCDCCSICFWAWSALRAHRCLSQLFWTIEAAYVLFPCWTQRREKLKNAVPLVVKCKSETRRGTKENALKTIQNCIEQVFYLLHDVIEHENGTSEKRWNAGRMMFLLCYSVQEKSAHAHWPYMQKNKTWGP